MDTNRKLTTGIYTATDSFRSIEKHIAVMFDDDCGLVAVVGPADDEHTQESWEYAQLFADAVNLRQALTEANALYNTVEGFNLELTERVAQDELAFKLMIEANTRLTEDVARLKAELSQCKHALDDEGENVCECGHSMDSHTKSGLHSCEECKCVMFWAKGTL